MPLNGLSARRFQGLSWKILITPTPPCLKRANPANLLAAAAECAERECVAAIFTDRRSDGDEGRANSRDSSLPDNPSPMEIKEAQIRPQGQRMGRGRCVSEADAGDNVAAEGC